MSQYCKKCGKGISDDEYSFSWHRFHKPLCRKDQPTEEARKIGKALESRGWKVIYEAFDDYKHVDLSIPDAKVDIEVDGLHHYTDHIQALRDLERARHSYKDGFYTVHIPNILADNDEILNKTIACLDKFLKMNLEDVKDNWFTRFIKGIFGN